VMRSSSLQSRTHRSSRVLSSPGKSTSLLEPTDGITSFPILTCLRSDPLVLWMKQRSPTFDGDYQRPMTPKRHTYAADPRVVSCIRPDPLASNPPPSNVARACHTRTARGFIGKAEQGCPAITKVTIPFRVRLPAQQNSLTRHETTQSTI
jgi:hypothetical protein